MGKIKIRCPYCSTLLTVEAVEGIESKLVTCPICKRKSPFTAFRVETGSAEEKPTNYGTDLNNIGRSAPVGSLIDTRSGNVYQLKLGNNIIGRKADSSKATIQIPTDDSRRMSREHLKITVQANGAQGMLHTIQLVKESVNNTSVNGVPLMAGDVLILRHGNTIELPDATLRFELRDLNDTDSTIL